MGVASSHLSLKGGGGGGSSAPLGQAGVGVPYPASSREFSPRAGSAPGTPDLLKVCQHPHPGGTDAFWCFWLFHGFHAAAGVGSCWAGSLPPVNPAQGVGQSRH